MRLEDLYNARVSGIPPPKTTARAALIRHAERLSHQQRKRPSILEELLAAKSPWQVDWLLEHSQWAEAASSKVRKRWERTAYVRKCQLAGVLP